MAFLQCPDCRLTVPASAYYLRGDECPRCLTAMEPCERFRREPRLDRAAVQDAIEAGKATRAAPAT
jgi:NaMN:DMB phosphoribosyltransferase